MFASQSIALAEPQSPWPPCRARLLQLPALPMVAGIIFATLGIEQTLAHVGEPLGTIPAVALCGGVALYLLGHNAFRLREEGSLSVPRLVVAVVCLALIGLGVTVSSILTLAVFRPHHKVCDTCVYLPW